MDFFMSPKKRILRVLFHLTPILVTVCALLIFLTGVNYTSGDTIEKEQQTLERALARSAVHAYALSGRYPESLDALLSEYGITYDHTRFVVEYLPSTSNLMPQITVIQLGKKEGS